MQTESLRFVLRIARSLAREYRHERYGAPHLLLALLHNEAGLASQLLLAGKDIGYLREWAEVRLEESPRAMRIPEEPDADEIVTDVLRLADILALQYNRDTDPLSTLAALLKPGIAFSPDQLKTLPLPQKEVVALFAGKPPQQEPDRESTSPVASEKQVNPFTIDKTALAAAGGIQPIIGRDDEIRQLSEILTRRNKPNVIITGEPGVGKSALVDGFAGLIAQQQVPGSLLNARVLELDTGALVAGASYKGEVEERLKGIIAWLKSFDKAILFIDEIHVLLDPKGSAGTGIVQLLKPELARGELTVIGATTQEEYRKYIEKDEAFSRRFEVLRVEEPDETAATKMIGYVLPAYEKHHGVTVEKGAVAEAVRLAKRYLKDRRLPDVALDLLDRTMAAFRLMNDVSSGDLEHLRNELGSLTATDEAEHMHELRWFDRRLASRLSPLLTGRMETVFKEMLFDTPEPYYQHLMNRIDALMQLAGNRSHTLGTAEIAAIVANKTGIPVGKLQSSDRDKLMGMEAHLKKRVIGQDHAVKALSEAIIESRSGLTTAGQPTGSFFLLGPTGTGKTEIAKTLAAFLFNDESFLIRFDMSEFKEEHSAALLYGAPPGYVGYEEGGLLVNKIRQKPYSVVLFDEIEKAHASVFDLFLQILDEGKLHDRLGNEGDFSNAVILFTSNIGQEHIIRESTNGKIPATGDLTEIMTQYFRPEFLARLTEIVPFSPVSEDHVIEIFNIHLNNLATLLDRQGIRLELSQEALRHIATKGFSPRYGVRPLKGVIRNEIRRPVSRMIVQGRVKAGSLIKIGIDENQELLWETDDAFISVS